MLIGKVLHTDGCSCCGEAETEEDGENCFFSARFNMFGLTEAKIIPLLPQGTDGYDQTRYITDQQPGVRSVCATMARVLPPPSARATESELFLLCNIGQRHLFNCHHPHTWGILTSHSFFCSSSSSCNLLFISSVVLFVFSHSIYFLTDTLPYHVSLSYIDISLL